MAIRQQNGRRVVRAVSQEISNPGKHDASFIRNGGKRNLPGILMVVLIETVMKVREFLFNPAHRII